MQLISHLIIWAHFFEQFQERIPYQQDRGNIRLEKTEYI
jgi:hypothetical protein